MNIFKFALIVSFLGSSFLSFSQKNEAKAGDSKKNKKETKFTEVVNTDSLPASEIFKRAINWIKLENPAYDKINGVTASQKAECIIAAPIKPKELNPGCDYTGTINLKVIIECKDSKYRYTVFQIKHESKTGKTTGGSIDEIVPECGSMVMSDNIWKKIKGEGNKLAARVIEDLKEFMIKDSTPVEEEW